MTGQLHELQLQLPADRRPPYNAEPADAAGKHLIASCSALHSRRPEFLSGYRCFERTEASKWVQNHLMMREGGASGIMGGIAGAAAGWMPMLVG